jgi:hypothetical protein
MDFWPGIDAKIFSILLVGPLVQHAAVSVGYFLKRRTFLPRSSSLIWILGFSNSTSLDSFVCKGPQIAVPGSFQVLSTRTESLFVGSPFRIQQAPRWRKIGVENNFLMEFVDKYIVIWSRTPDELGHDHTLGSVVDKYLFSVMMGLPHEHFLLLTPRLPD